MDTLKTRIITRTGAIMVLLILVAAMPSATAQTIPAGCDIFATSTISLSGESVQIEQGGTADMRVDYEYRAPAQAFSLEPVEIAFHESGSPAWANVVLSEQSVFVDVAPLEETHHIGALTLTVSLHEEAPVGERAVFEIEGDAREGTCVTAATGAADSEILVVGDETEAEPDGDEIPEVNQNAIPTPGAIIGLVALFALLVPIARRRI